MHRSPPPSPPKTLVARRPGGARARRTRGGFTLVELGLSVLLLVAGVVILVRYGWTPWLQAALVGWLAGRWVGGETYAALRARAREQDGVGIKVLLILLAVGAAVWLIPASHQALGYGVLVGFAALSFALNAMLRRSFG